jgi:hypothetical protein
MKRHHRLLGLLATVVAVVAGCSSTQVCTLVGGIPHLTIDFSFVEAGDPASMELCVDDQCQLVDDVVDGAPSRIGRLDLVGDDPTRELILRDLDGTVLAGPTQVTVPEVFPNGEGCGDAILTGSFVVTPSGEFEPS